MFKTQVEPPVAGEWFHCKVLNILWSIRVQTMENCTWLVGGCAVVSFWAMGGLF